MFNGLLDRYQQEREHEEMLFGIVAATVANHGYRYPSNPVSFTQYMPSQRHAHRLERAKPVTPEELKSKLDRIFGT